MASGSGSWSSTNAGGNRGRLTWQVDQSPSSVGAGTSSVSLRLRVWFESRYSIVDSSNTYTVTGAWSGSGSRSINHGGSGGKTLLYDGTITVPTSYANTVSRSFSASFTGINALPSIPSVSGSHTVGRRPVSAPNAATGVAATRSSDSRQNVSWSASSTSARPIDSQTVQRRETGADGSWLSWKNVSGALSGGARSWADTSTVANRQYQYRVVTRNAAGSATSSGSLSIRTTPGVPSSVSAVKQADGSIRVSYTPTTPYADYLTHVLQDSPNGGAWVTVATQEGSDPIVVTDPNPAVTHRYRVATRSTYSNPGTLTSAYSSPSNVVQLLAPPNAPTLLAPTGILDRDEPFTFSWRHNPVDSSDQTAYELRIRQDGGAWSTFIGTTASTRTFFALGVSSTIEWQARTKGAHPDWSPWSAIGSFSLAAAPTVAINTPDGGTLAQSRVTLTIGYATSDGSPQARVQAELVHDGRVIETLSWSGTSDTRSFKTALDDDAEYTVRARVQAGNGLWSEWDDVTFTTDFPVPVAFEPDAVWDRATGSVTVGGHQLDMLPGEVMADSITIQRRDSADSPWVTLAEDVDPGTEITDPLPALGVPEYRIISHTVLPSSNTGPAIAVPWVHGPHDLVYVNTGPGYELVGTARGDQASNDYSIEQSSFHAAGIDLPIAIFGTSETGSLSFTGRIFDPRIGVEPVTTRNEWRALLRQRQVVCYRDCQGRKMFGLLHVSFSQQGPIETVNITVDEVWHEEGAVA